MTQPIARAIIALSARRLSGALTVAQGDIQVRCYFADGRIVWAESSVAADAPSKLAAHAGVLTAQAAENLASASLDEVADATGLAGERKEALRQRMAAHAALRMFALTEPAADTEPGALPPRKVVPIDARWLVHRGVRACYDEARFVRELGSAMHRPFAMAAGARLEVFRFSSDEARVAARLAQGSADLAQLGRAAPALSRPQLLAVLYALVVAGLARPVASTDASAAQGATALITDLAKKIDGGADHFALFGQRRNSRVTALRGAYFDLAKKLHPDRLRAAGVASESVIREGKRVLAHVNQAFAVLSDPARRERYERSLGDSFGDDADSAAARILAGEDCFRRGEAALRRGRVTEAVAELSRAVKLSPEEGEHHAALAWAQWLAAEDKAAARGAAIRGLEHAIELSPKSATAHFYRGQIAKQSGNNERALASFRQVLALNPHHADAQLEVRLLEGRKKRESTRGGFFRKR